MITFKGEGCYFVANYSRNMVSTYSFKELFQNDITIKTEVKIDWKKIEKEEHSYKGIVSFNGMHFGIMIKVDNGDYLLSAEIWTMNKEGIYVLNDCYLKLDRNTYDDWRKIKLELKQGKSISLETTEGKRKLELNGKIPDHSTSYLWIGCQDNHRDTPEKHRGNFIGQMKSLQIDTSNGMFFDSDFKKRTRYKIFDFSGNGNHLLKSYLNDDGNLIVY